MLVFLRQGKLAKWFSGIGRKLSPLGNPLDRDEYPAHAPESPVSLPLSGKFRSTGTVLPVDGKPGGFTKGRGLLSFTWYTEFKIIRNDLSSGPLTRWDRRHRASQ